MPSTIRNNSTLKRRKPEMSSVPQTECDLDENAGDTCLLLSRRPSDTQVRYSAPEGSIWSMSIQMFIPFLLAGFGMVAASLLLDEVQHWPVYKEVTEVYILVPALLGLKGNLEMTLASRLSTHANLGHLDNRSQQWSLISGNMALILCQAVVVGFLAAVTAVVMGWVPKGVVDPQHAFLLCASSVVTAFGASFVLGMIMVGVILVSRYFNINPDNVATPIAAALGDLLTLACLSWLATVFYDMRTTHAWLPVFLTVITVVLVPLWAYIAYRNQYTHEVLFYGWTPVLAAMLISSAGGFILGYTVTEFKGVAVFQLVINGVGGNLVAVQASRISTELHQIGHLAEEPCLTPCAAFCDTKRTNHAKTACMLMLMVAPGHLIFSYTISYLQAGHTSSTPIFIAVYLAAAHLQVFLLLYIAQIMVLKMWKNGIDPDNSAIPYLTAIGDLLGTLLLGIAFQVLFLIGDGDSDVGD